MLLEIAHYRGQKSLTVREEPFNPQTPLSLCQKGRVAQRQSTRFTCEGLQVRPLSRPPA